MRRVVSLFLPHRPNQAGSAPSLEKLAAWCRRYTPLAAPAPPDGVWLDITGCAGLFGGEAALLADLTHRLAHHDRPVRAALADTPGAAHAIARYGPASGPHVIDPGAQARALAALPIVALRLAPEVVEGLGRLGLDRIGQLYAAARAPLARRFGPSVCQRLDQALGREFEPIEPIFPAEAPQRHLSFLEPIGTAESLHAAIAELVGRLCPLLEKAGLGSRRLDLLCRRVDGLPQMLRIATARPSRDAAHLTRLLAERIEIIDPGFGIEAMTLAATLVEPVTPTQLGGLDKEGRRPAPDLAELVDRLANRFGPNRLYRTAPVESELPERSLRRLAPLAPPARCTWPAALLRPVRLFAPPEPVRAMALLPDHPPRMFVWRHRQHAIRRADGPERIFGEWWQAESEATMVRDYFQVEDESGARFWLFRSSDETGPGGGQWFLHGLFG